jgi:hypothetical protein
MLVYLFLFVVSFAAPPGSFRRKVGKVLKMNKGLATFNRETKQSKSHKPIESIDTKKMHQQFMQQQEKSNATQNQSNDLVIQDSGDLPDGNETLVGYFNPDSFTSFEEKEPENLAPANFLNSTLSKDDPIDSENKSASTMKSINLEESKNHPQGSISHVADETVDSPENKSFKSKLQIFGHNGDPAKFKSNKKKTDVTDSQNLVKVEIPAKVKVETESHIAALPSPPAPFLSSQKDDEFPSEKNEELKYLIEKSPLEQNGIRLGLKESTKRVKFRGLL